MNSYDLTRIWWNHAFDNPDIIKPIHHAVYHFAIEQCNRLGWPPKFRFPTEMVISAIGVRSYNTYINAFRDIEKWGFIEVLERSQNQYSSNIIALLKNTKAKDKAHPKPLDKAIILHDVKHTLNQVQSTPQTIDSSIKPLNQETTNQETTNQETEDPPILDDFPFSEKNDRAQKLIEFWNETTGDTYSVFQHAICQLLYGLFDQKISDERIQDVIILKYHETQVKTNKRQPIFQPEWMTPFTVFHSDKFPKYDQAAQKWRSGQTTEFVSESTSSRISRQVANIPVKLYD